MNVFSLLKYRRQLKKKSIVLKKQTNSTSLATCEFDAAEILI
jgi:hypothetical protein